MVADQKVILVFSLRSRPGLKAYFRRLREAGDGRRGGIPKTEPELDDAIDQAARFSPEQAVAMRAFWRGQGYGVVVEDTQGRGPLFERNQSTAVPQTDAGHGSQFVPLQGGGYDGRNVGFVVKHNPQRGWYIRSTDVPSLAAEHKDLETLWSSESAEDVVSKVIYVWTLATAVPFPDPQAAQRAGEARQQASQLSPGVRIRPGSR